MPYSANPSVRSVPDTLTLVNGSGWGPSEAGGAASARSDVGEDGGLPFAAVQLPDPEGDEDREHDRADDGGHEKRAQAAPLEGLGSH